MRRLWTILVLVTLVGIAGVASAGRPHFVGSPTCTVVDDQLCCSGKIAGLGTAPTTVEVDAPFNCTNRGEHQPGGLASGQSAPITPRGGQITFTNVCTEGATCPDQMTETFGPTVTLNVFQKGNLIFSATVPIS